MPVEGSRDPSEGIDPIERAAALFEPGDHGLGGAHSLGQLTLARPGLGAQVIDELPEPEILTPARRDAVVPNQAPATGRVH